MSTRPVSVTIEEHLLNYAQAEVEAGRSDPEASAKVARMTAHLLALRGQADREAAGE